MFIFNKHNASLQVAKILPGWPGYKQDLGTLSFLSHRALVALKQRENSCLWHTVIIWMEYSTTKLQCHHFDALRSTYYFTFTFSTAIQLNSWLLLLKFWMHWTINLHTSEIESHNHSDIVIINIHTISISWLNHSLASSGTAVSCSVKNIFKVELQSSENYFLIRYQSISPHDQPIYFNLLYSPGKCYIIM